jgi:Flp pilus assembly protein TadD
MFEKAIGIRPTNMAFSNRGTANTRAGRFEAALTAYEKALQFDTSDSLAWGNIAQLYSLMGDRSQQSLDAFAKAIELAEAARQQNPRDPYIYSDLALYYTKTGNTELALQRLQSALTLAPDSGEIQAVAAETYELLGKRQRAVESAEKALAMGYPGQRLLYNQELAELVAVLGLGESP